jgi:hypothetical protein
MPEGTTGDRGLYMRCLACETGGLRPACEECGGAGFVPTGLTLDMLTQLVGEAQELAHLGVSIARASGARRSGQGRNGH